MNKLKVNISELLITLGLGLVTIAWILILYFSNFSSSVNAMVTIAWVLLCLGLAYLTAWGQTILEFCLQAKIELLKVVWPTRQETVQTTGIVMAMVAVTGFILWGLDSIMMLLIAKITHLG